MRGGKARVQVWVGNQEMGKLQREDPLHRDSEERPEQPVGACGGRWKVIETI